MRTHTSPGHVAAPFDDRVDRLDHVASGMKQAQLIRSQRPELGQHGRVQTWPGTNGSRSDHLGGLDADRFQLLQSKSPTATVYLTNSRKTWRTS
jgi:hypothetical protein